MNRPYAMTRLLEHGPLSRSEVREITGWTEKAVDDNLRLLANRNRIERFIEAGRHQFIYRLHEVRA